MPTHVMSCFRLPKAVTTKLTSAVANFWWSSNNQTRGMHWLAWRKLCRHKSDGGLGFRVIEDFNTALLAKQLWRLMDNPDSLFARVFKGRYYRNSTPLDPIRSYSPSYGWQSIISARSLVHKGLIKRVGSGSTIFVWYDPWISDSRPRSAICKGVNYYPQLMVGQLINSQTSTWNLPLLHQLFDNAEIARITGITVATGYRPDTNGWFYTKTGRYTVKSEYHILQQLPDQEVMPVVGPDIRPLQARAWKVKCTTKLQHFMWQIITGCLSVGARLCSRGLRVDPQCVRCGMGEEIINHMLFECPPSRQAWALSPIPTHPQGSTYKVFSNDDQDPRDVLDSAITEARDWAAAQTAGEVVPLHAVTQIERVTSGEWCQVDGAWKDTECRAGLGWYNFDPESGLVLVGACNLRRGLTPLQTELEALTGRHLEFYLRRWRSAEGSSKRFLTRIPRKNNTKADKLARCARAQPHDV
ncbi:unnamed protein product [Microthlaspi erraticum]|uniref:Reverse transcriptase zinc-binding domain-containing protein n=1 Tax=Microthlaspi erraticum TaxID=1685480 RepID=A0A6D2JHA8_9BRAS|nr:unnamed protein product [Microthlaspi erraticum]